MRNACVCLLDYWSWGQHVGYQSSNQTVVVVVQIDSRTTDRGWGEGSEGNISSPMGVCTCSHADVAGSRVAKVKNKRNNISESSRGVTYRQRKVPEVMKKGHMWGWTCCQHVCSCTSSDKCVKVSGFPHSVLMCYGNFTGACWNDMPPWPSCIFEG